MNCLLVWLALGVTLLKAFLVCQSGKFSFSFVMDTWGLLGFGLLQDVSFPLNQGKVKFSSEYLCRYSYFPLSVNLLWLHTSS